jgi:predicted dehydrogenase
VIEGEALVSAARKYGRVVQVNTQRRSNPLYLEARDKYIRSGRLGRIGLVETYSYLGSEGWARGPVPDAAVPSHLNFDLWTGPAPLLPFKAIMENRGWRAFMEYGNGPIGNLGVHMIDQVRWLLGLGWPDSIYSSGGIYVEKASFSNIPDTQRSVFHYPDLDMSWQHRLWGGSPIPQRHWSDQWGARFIGEKGTLNLTMLEYAFTPADGGPREGVHMLSKTGDLENVDFSLEGHAYTETENRHVLDFMRARERTAPVHLRHRGGAYLERVLRARQPFPAAWPGRRLRSQDPNGARGDAEATRLLARPYRAPWAHPEPA